MNYEKENYACSYTEIAQRLNLTRNQVIAILSIMFGDYKHITMFFTLMLWMTLWTPILIIINYFNDMNLRETFMATKDVSGAGFTLNHNRMIMNKLLENSNFVNWMVMVTPLLAYAIAKASEHGFVSLASSLSQSMQGAARSGASEIQKQSTSEKPSIRVGNDVYGDIGGANDSSNPKHKQRTLLERQHIYR